MSVRVMRHKPAQTALAAEWTREGMKGRKFPEPRIGGMAERKRPRTLSKPESSCLIRT